ncbi:hypothetical protein [Rhodoplanes serenus]|uniref:hypothetical protein n=1 Tax=Rhodoplanes serenus TaxID=200615 RepID=UPI000DABEC4A|nr:hypothetical protein [Rhodoplanes serenus]RAI30800.1 hypothetical protein CH340_20510 [Rhodoplanes serenus]
MALELDGFAVLHRIGANRAAFEGISSEVAKVARSLLVKLLKDKRTGVDGVRAVRAALGAEPFALIVDGLTDAEIKSTAKRLDKHNPVLIDGDAATVRKLVGALADGSTEPASRPRAASRGSTKAPKSKKEPTAPKTIARVSFKSAGATRGR